MRADEVRRVGVVGGGLMGSGMVEVCARAGLPGTFAEATSVLVAPRPTAPPASPPDPVGPYRAHPMPRMGQRAIRGQVYTGR